MHGVQRRSQYAPRTTHLYRPACMHVALRALAAVSSDGLGRVIRMGGTCRSLTSKGASGRRGEPSAPTFIEGAVRQQLSPPRHHVPRLHWRVRRARRARPPDKANGSQLVAAASFGARDQPAAPGDHVAKGALWRWWYYFWIGARERELERARFWFCGCGCGGGEACPEPTSKPTALFA